MPGSRSIPTACRLTSPSARRWGIPRLTARTGIHRRLAFLITCHTNGRIKRAQAPPGCLPCVSLLKNWVSNAWFCVEFLSSRTSVELTGRNVGMERIPSSRGGSNQCDILNTEFARCQDGQRPCWERRRQNGSLISRYLKSRRNASSGWNVLQERLQWH